MRHRTIWTILAQIIALICAVGIFVLVVRILAEDLPPPEWLPFDPHKHVWLPFVMKFFGVFLITPPLVSLMVSFVTAGHRGWGESVYDADKPIELRLASGAKYTGAGLCILICGAIVGAAIWQNEPLSVWLFISPVILAGLYGLVLCFAVRATYDSTSIASIYYSLKWRRNSWADLTNIGYDSGPGDIILSFGKERQRLSAYYNGIGTLLDFANVKLNEAHLARSGPNRTQGEMA